MLLTIGKICLKAGKYADLAIFAIKEYLLLLTYYKMFSLAAGQAIKDQASVQSGYTMLREKTMLLLANAYDLLA